MFLPRPGHWGFVFGPRSVQVWYTVVVDVPLENFSTYSRLGFCVELAGVIAKNWQPTTLCASVLYELVTYGLALNVAGDSNCAGEAVESLAPPLSVG